MIARGNLGHPQQKKNAHNPEITSEKRPNGCESRCSISLKKAGEKHTTPRPINDQRRFKEILITYGLKGIRFLGAESTDHPAY